ncbi:MAG: TIGR02147 family protein [Fibrobacter sp.]|nr:TIGR02147 family protein [Fibrobacter sp.]
MIEFSDTQDYRDFLKEYYDRRKAEMPLYSYRMMGDKLGLDSSYLYRVLQKKQHLPAHALPAAKDILALSGRQAEYFELLYSAAVTKDKGKREELMAKALSLRDVHLHSLQQAELKLLENWWIPAVRAYLELNGGVVNLKQIANDICPPITEAQAKEAIDTLLEVGLVKKMASGKLALTDAHLTVGGPEKAKVVRHFQKEVLQLAGDSLENIDVNQRNVSTLTLSVDQACFDDLGDMLKEFRRLVQKRVDGAKNPDRVMQLSMAFFPIARKNK